MLLGRECTSCKMNIQCGVATGNYVHRAANLGRLLGSPAGICVVFTPLVLDEVGILKSFQENSICLLSKSSSSVSVWPCGGRLACRILFHRKECMVCKKWE